MNNINKTIILSVISSSLLLGATPNIGDIEKQIKPPKIEKEKPTLPSIGSGEYKAPMIDSGKTLYIKSFSFSGNEHISNDTLKNIAKEYENKDLTFTQLNELTAKITKLYRQKGYFVARAYLPQQNINENDNVLEIAIIEGNYGEFHLKNNSLVKDSILQGMLDYAKRDNIVSTRTLEQSMLIINDTPGAVVTKADVMPGAKVGTSDFTIETQATNPYDGYIILDNTGSRYTGKNRVMAGVNFNSPFKIGDKLSLSGLVSNGADLTNARVAYSAPLMSNGLRGELSYTQTNYSLVELDGAPDDTFTGDSKTLEGKLSYPIIRTRVENLYTNIVVGKKDLNDEYDSTKLNPRDSKYIRAGAEYSKVYLAFGKNNKSGAELTFTYGDLSFDNEEDKINDKAGANTNGNYSKVNLDLSHNIALTQKLTLESSLKMQYAFGNKNLDGSEDISIGGPTGVKVYPSGELSAENGYVFNIEAKYSLPTFFGISNSIGVFYDRGRAWMSDSSSSSTFEAKSLQDVGLGYYGSYKDFFLKSHLAYTINHEVTAEPVYHSKFLVQAGWVF